MDSVTLGFPIQHEGRTYTARVTVCSGCLDAEAADLLAEGATVRSYGAGEGAFTLQIEPREAAASVNGTEAA
jgi:hypothetical protein